MIDHEPPRTARTEEKKLLPNTSTPSTKKLTLRANAGAAANDVEDP